MANKFFTKFVELKQRVWHFLFQLEIIFSTEIKNDMKNKVSEIFLYYPMLEKPAV